MIDVIGLALGAAQQILANVLSDSLLRGRAARRREIERGAMERASAQPGLSKSDIDILTTRIVSEVRYLVNQHPDLEWRMTGVRVVPPVPSARPVTPHAANALLRERLQRLNRIARTRWEQVQEEPASTPPARPTPFPEPMPTPPTPAESTAGSQVVGVQDFNVEQSNYWHQRLEGMRANVQADQRRRAAGELPAPLRLGDFHTSDPIAPIPESPPES